MVKRGASKFDLPPRYGPSEEQTNEYWKKRFEELGKEHGKMLADATIKVAIQPLLDRNAALEADNAKLRAWVREAIEYMHGGHTEYREFSGPVWPSSVVFKYRYICRSCQANGDTRHSIPHTEACIETRGEKLLKENRYDNNS